MSGVTLVDCGEPFQTPILGQISTLGNFVFLRARRAQGGIYVESASVVYILSVLLANSLYIFTTTQN